jgi:hypothetical protein
MSQTSSTKDDHLKELATNDRVTSDQLMEEILEKAEGISAHLFRGPLLDVLRGVRAFV